MRKEDGIVSVESYHVIRLKEDPTFAARCETAHDAAWTALSINRCIDSEVWVETVTHSEMFEHRVSTDVPRRASAVNADNVALFNKLLFLSEQLGEKEWQLALPAVG